MRVALIAVGHRLPAWAETAVADYAKRLPAEMAFVIKAIKAEPRSSGKPPAALMAAEATRIRTAIPKGARCVVFDERGTRVDTVTLAQRLRVWQSEGRDLALLMGGADGLDPQLKAAADETLRLSDLTLPHALARVLLVEALYRAWTVSIGHPYHRE